MRRSERLLDLIQILRDGRLHRAAELADRMSVSVRTIWRDMATLMASGLPVEGARGVGYILRTPIALPPMILTPDELQALRLGIRLAADYPDPVLQRGARSLASKIAAVMPEPLTEDPDDLFVFAGDKAARAAPHLPILRRAIRLRERISIAYLDDASHQTHRDIRPLQLEFWGRVWSLAAYCEARGDFRSFRIDRIQSITETGEIFPNEQGRRLEDYLVRAKPEDAT